MVLADRVTCDWCLLTLLCPQVHWCFKLVFAANAVTIASTGFSERSSLPLYLLFTSCISIWLYPVVAYWVWVDTGWLRQAGDEVQSPCLLNICCCPYQLPQAGVHNYSGCLKLTYFAFCFCQFSRI